MRINMKLNTLNNSRGFEGLRVSPPPGAFAALKKIWQDFRHEHAAFIVTCIYLIFEYNRPQSVWPAIDIIPWGKSLILLAIILAISDKVSSKPPSAALRPLIAFSACVIISMAFALSPSLAIKGWVSYFGWVFVVLLITSVVNTRQRLYLFLAVYFLVNLKMAQHGFISWAMRGFSFEGWGVTGSPGWFQNSGEFGMEMAVFLPFVLVYIAFFRHGWSRSVRLFFYVFTIMVAGSIIASSNRGAIIGLIIVGLWALVYSRQRFKTILLVAMGAVLIYNVMPAEFKARFETIGEDQTSLNRLNYWNAGKAAIRDNPFSGVGFQNWTLWVSIKHPELEASKDDGVSAEVIHNTYMEAATELGYLGLTVYILILLQIFFTNRRTLYMAKKLNDRFLEATGIGLNGSLIVYLVTSNFMSILYYPYIWVMLSLTICLSTACKRIAINQQQSIDLSRFR